MQKKRIAVLFGGHSSEYEVSLQSAFSVLENLNADRYEILPIGITKQGDFYRYNGKYEKIRDNTWADDTENLIPVVISQNRSTSGIIELAQDKCRTIKIDLAFPVLHGKNGEDGTVQGLLELAGIPVVGCNTLSYINRFGVKAFAVATIDEGIELRSYGIRDEILILGFTPPVRAKELHKYDLMQTLIDENYATELNKQGFDVKAHIKIDTGMHRLGFDCADAETVKKAFTMQHIKVCGIYTHLCVSDSLDTENVRFSEIQIQRFYGLIDSLKKDGIEIPKIHIQSSYGLLNYPELKCNYIRVGIALYGVLSSPNDQTKLQLALRPVLSLKSQIILIRQIHSGESVGYGRTFIAERDSRIAVVPIGYADGLPRTLSCGNGEVLINGQRAPIVGRICMDQLCVDVTDVDGIAIGNVVTLIGKDGNDELSAAGVASDSDSITNELLSRMGARLKIRSNN